MAKARFCSECGERLKVKRFSFLLFRSFCSECSPRFSPDRVMLIVVLAISLAIGFAIGHFTHAREPFYYIGAAVESSSSGAGDSIDEGAAHSSRKSERVISPGTAEGICGARTKSGKPCQRKLKGAGYCWQHRDRIAGKQMSPTRKDR